MMRALFLLSLVSLTASAQLRDPRGRFERVNRRCDQGRSNRGLDCGGLAFFEFAPSNGAGMGTACACTTPTGAKGETLTFTRAGDATCSKQGLATTGIANGDLVVCTANQPRVESSGGVLGLRVEGARTNVLLRTQELDNAAWTWENGGGAGATTRTNDFAVAPDGTTTAERLQIPATSGVQFSDVYQAFTASGAAVPQTCSVFVRGNDANGTTDICTYDGSSWVCSDCVFANGSWSRCSRSFATGAASSRFCKFGNNSNQNGGVARSAADIFEWGFMAEEGAYATSYIPTVAAAVTRNVEAAYFSRSIATTAGVCSAATHEVPSTTGYSAGSGLLAPLLSSLSGSAGSPYFWPYTVGAGTGLAIDGTGSTGAPSGWAPGTSNTSTFARYVAGHNGTAWTICKDAVCSSNGVASAWSSPTYPFIKFDVTTVTPVVIWTRVQVDPSFSRCTP